MKSLYLLFPLLFIVIPHFVSAQTKPGYVAEVYFVVGPEIVQNYVKLGYTKATAVETIRQDMNFLIYEVNKYYATMERGGLFLQIRMTKLDFLDVLFEDCKLIHHKDLQADLAIAVFKAFLEDNKSFDKSPYDIAVALTGFDLFSIDEPQTTGYAQTEAACLPGLAVVEYVGTQKTAIVIAHELGHSLGALHDITSECPSSDGYILAPTSNGESRHRWEFSQCSIEGIHKYMNKLHDTQQNCLTKETTQGPHTFDISSLNGRDIMDPQKICQRSWKNATSYFCTSPNLYGGQLPIGDQVCKYIYCGLPKSTSCRMFMPTEGMVCDVGKRCAKGKCVKAPKAFPTPSSVKAGCVFGDTKSDNIFNGKGDCENFLRLRGVTMCYNKRVFAYCCKTCADKMNGIADINCQFGDKSSKCSKYPIDHLCTRPENRETCCYRCRDVVAGNDDLDGIKVALMVTFFASCAECNRNYKVREKRSDIPAVPYILLAEDDADIQEPIEFDEAVIF